MTAPSTSIDLLLSPKALMAARGESRAGGGTVLDVLLRHWPGDADQLLEQLEARTGVAPVTSAIVVEPTFDRWPAEDVRKHRCVALKTVAGQVIAAASDPWSTDLHRIVERALGADVPLLAASGLQLDAWSRGAPSATQAGAPTVNEVSGPIVSFVDAAIQRAIAIGASDVHF
jgi:hypothetical protein